MIERGDQCPEGEGRQRDTDAGIPWRTHWWGSLLSTHLGLRQRSAPVPWNSPTSLRIPRAVMRSRAALTEARHLGSEPDGGAGLPYQPNQSRIETKIVLDEHFRRGV
jgi:hypothetical protein